MNSFRPMNEGQNVENFARKIQITIINSKTTIYRSPPPFFTHRWSCFLSAQLAHVFSSLLPTYLHTLVGMAPNVAYIACTCECIKVTKRNFVCCCSSCCNCMPQYITFSIAMCPIIPHYLDANDSISSFKYGCQWSQCFVARRYLKGNFRTKLVPL